MNASKCILNHALNIVTKALYHNVQHQNHMELKHVSNGMSRPVFRTTVPVQKSSPQDQHVDVS